MVRVGTFLLAVFLGPVSAFHAPVLISVRYSRPGCENWSGGIESIGYGTSVRLGSSGNNPLEGEDDDHHWNDVNPFQRLWNWLASSEGQQDLKTFFVSLSLALMLRFTVIEPRYIPSTSMVPTLRVGDQLAVEKVTKLIKPLYRGEVVVFRPTEAFQEQMRKLGVSTTRTREALIKRIVAIEGDKVEMKDGKLYVNDMPQEEPYTAENASYDFGPVMVAPGTVFVLGDNRNHSFDGHNWGFLPAKNVIGRAVFVYWPPWRMGSSDMQ